MKTMADKNYVGNGVKNEQYDLINFSVCLSDLRQDDVFEYNGKRYCKLTIGSKKDGVDQYGKTHSVWVNDYKPEPQAETSAPATPTPQEADLPF